jgi:DNA polymerase-3 subunit beta
MKFTIEKNRLLQSINTVSKGMNSRSTIPIFSGIYIEAASDGVIFETTDLEVSIKHIEEALIEQQGATVAPGKLFGDIIKSLPEAAINLQLDGEQLIISCQESSFTIDTMSPADFPQFPQVITNRSISIETSQLAGMVKKVSKAVSRDISRAILTGVNFKVENNQVQLVATDSYRLAIARSTLSTEDTTQEAFELIIPGNVLEEISHLATDEKIIKVGETENQIIFLFGSTTFISRKIEGNYPNYDQIIPNQKNVSVTVETELILNAVRRVSIVAKNSSPIRFILHAHNQTLEIAAQTQEIGAAKESIPAQIDGEEIEIGFNHQYILDGLNAIDSDEIVFEAQTALKPGTFRTLGDDYYFYLTMPVRLER